MEAMRSAFVLVDADERRARIIAEVETAARAVGGNARIDAGNLEQVNCLNEWPVAVSCAFEREFLAVPQEALVETMEANQKFFPVLDAGGKLTEHFIGIANIESKDPSEIRKGYERVIRPRFADAKFFFDEDLKQGLVAMGEGNTLAETFLCRGRIDPEVFQRMTDMLGGTVSPEREAGRRLSETHPDRLDLDRAAQIFGGFVDVIDERVESFGEIVGGRDFDVGPGGRFGREMSRCAQVARSGPWLHPIGNQNMPARPDEIFFFQVKRSVAIRLIHGILPGFGWAGWLVWS